MDVGNAARASEPLWIGRTPHEPLAPNEKPLVPDRDPFYLPPAGFEHAEPGTVLRSRDVELAFLGLIRQRVTATQLLYRTTDMSRGTRGGRHHRDRARRTLPAATRARWSPTSAPSTR